MKKSLVIVESPAKAKTINKFLGKEYLVKSCVGHIRDLPTSRTGKRYAKDDLPDVPKQGEKYVRTIRSMGVNPYKNWEAKYEILPGKEKVIAELEQLASDADLVYLATDLDREGEAIAWNLTEILGKDKDYKRVIFSEITKEAIQDAFKQPAKLDDNKVKAQQTRRYLDRVVGYMLSPLLWKKVARGLSAGRVQSVAVKLVTEREREIRRFVPDEFWTLHCILNSGKKAAFQMEVVKHKGDKYKPVSKEEVDKAMAAIKGAKISVKEVKETMKNSSPPPPFITSTLQQAASTRMGFSVKRTMVAAQKLYEAGHITYMRTDSVNISKQSLAQCRSYLADSFAKEYLPEQPRYYKSRSKQAQEAHEAIRPSNVEMTPEKLLALGGSLGSSEMALYKLIHSRFVASQMSDAVFRSLKVTASAGDYEMQVIGRTMIFDGFMKVSPAATKDAVELPPGIKEGDELKLKDFLPEQHFTKPPPRFNEASLVKELERLEIGRPSTYAPIISTIQERGYVRLINKRFHAEKIAEIVTNRLDSSFPNLLAYDFTASMEDKLDEIANSKEKWTEVLDKFYQEFIEQLEQADSENGMRENSAVPTKIKCPDCQRAMVIRNSATGIFLGCTGYEDKENPCKKTINLLSVTENIDLPDTGKSEGDGKDDSDAEAGQPDAQPEQKKSCPVCKSPMEDYAVDAEHLIHICERNPDCEGNLIEKGDFSDRVPEAEELDCDRCGGKMELKSGRFGKYFECGNEECGNKRRVLANGEIMPTRMVPIETDIPCDKYPESNYIIREGALGLFLAAPGFPKQRETRSPYVRELIPYKDKIDKKYHYLLDAPQEDKDGNLFQVRYSRKQAENYVATSGEDKRKIFQQAFYRKKQWQLEDANSPMAKARKAVAKTKVIKAGASRARARSAARKKTA